MLFPYCRRLLQSLLAVAAILFTQALSAQQTQIELSEAIVAASKLFLSGLDAQQSERASFEFNEEERLNWHFIPRAREGVALKELTPEQLRSARELLQTLFSAKGFQKTENVRDLENVLAVLEPNGPFVRDPDLYYLTVFGTPSMIGAWAIRYEGHHLAFNWTFIEGAGIASTPQFFGSNPAEVRDGEKQGTRVLAAEEDMGRQLLKSLNEMQRGEAVLSGDAPRDIFTAAQKQIKPLEDVGISYGQLNTQQQEIMLAIISEVASAQSEVVANARLRTIMADGIDTVKFAWIGGFERGDAHYYRIQGGSFLIEYDNTQNDANHVHLVWRDFDGDFGRDLIRLHYDAVAVEHSLEHRH
ncbi:MAG: hypothetical protein COB20_00580 [SAR86 cluster bacterium]|uniref:DUF3500 domain-containing protein n=1 Tax=SAR86 cluster bacterium TaxID=2030880 RepID=A0A2A4XI09_9GAMM|nr:MAG: hypothetical protein COB20_00580 [SAR86 cluster bacterium]